jgi:hypothetical protein
MKQRKRKAMLRAEIDQQLLKAMQTPATAMTNQDWDDIRNEGRKLANKRNHVLKHQPQRGDGM